MFFTSQWSGGMYPRSNTYISFSLMDPTLDRRQSDSPVFARIGFSPFPFLPA